MGYVATIEAVVANEARYTRDLRPSYGTVTEHEQIQESSSSAWYGAPER